MEFFRDAPPTHRTLVNQTLSLLDSALPEMHFLNLDLLTKLLGVLRSSAPVAKDSKKVP